MNYDFGGWATKHNLRCSDGRVIMPNAFSHHDGQKIPLVWNHNHSDPHNVLGHAVLENRAEGVYAYCTFNDTESGQNAKQLVHHGDVESLSINANQLRQTQKGNIKQVNHGQIRELSLVLAGANPGAFIDVIMSHSDSDDEAALIYTGESINLEEGEFDMSLSHAAKDSKEGTKEETIEDVFNTLSEKQKTVVYALIGEAMSAEEDIDDEDEEMSQSATSGDATIGEVFNTLNDTQKTAVYALIGEALQEKGDDDTMKHNVFEGEVNTNETLSHADSLEIIKMAKSNAIGSLQKAIEIFTEGDDELRHSFEDISVLFPEHELLKPGAPDIVQDDQAWVTRFMSRVHKSPISRIRTRQTDIRGVTTQGKGYVKGNEKTKIGNLKLVSRTTDPTTIYVKDELHRDDIVDITDFDIVTYQYKIMEAMLKETVAVAAMLGDGREDGVDKIDDDKVRPIWLDDELYTIHVDVDIAAFKAEIQGIEGSKNFGESYIYAEAMITTALFARENYKGSGALDFFCTPHLLNQMLLARDMNGRRIYESKTDLARALDVETIQTVTAFENKTRTTSDSKTKKLLGMFVNMMDYNLGATKGGAITGFNQFDIDFNTHKYLIETRLSGALTKVKAAIVLEEDVTVSQG